MTKHISLLIIFAAILALGVSVIGVSKIIGATYGYSESAYYNYAQSTYVSVNSWKTSAPACGATGTFMTTLNSCVGSVQTQACH